jgi:hypothetical protein
MCLIGTDLEVVRAVVALEDPTHVVNDLWPKLTSVDIRVPEVVIVRVWPYADSFIDNVYRRFLVAQPPPPPPFRHNRPHLPSFSMGYSNAAALLSRSSQSSGSEGDESRYSECL